MAILAADWMHVVAVGLPLAALCAAVGSVIGAWAGGESPPAQIIAVAKAPAPAIGLVAACLLMVAMLIVQSLGDIPSEPFGGGGARETILGAGRPVVQLLAGVAIMVVATKAWRNNGFSETGWAALAIGRAAPLMLLLGAAGGLQALAQGSHMAELLAEKVLPLPLGLAVPFLAAAVMKTLQGSPLVAAITAAGMAQPLLPALGLDGDMGRALAVLAVGAGAMAVSHVNDGLFWLVGDGAGMRPAQALKWFSSLSLLQAAVALAGLVLVQTLG
jgi:GntP family gluconate:H+ symporter